MASLKRRALILLASGGIALVLVGLLGYLLRVPIVKNFVLNDLPQAIQKETLGAVDISPVGLRLNYERLTLPFLELEDASLASSWLDLLYKTNRYELSAELGRLRLEKLSKDSITASVATQTDAAENKGSNAGQSNLQLTGRIEELRFEELSFAAVAFDYRGEKFPSSDYDIKLVANNENFRGSLQLLTNRAEAETDMHFTFQANDLCALTSTFEASRSLQFAEKIGARFFEESELPNDSSHKEAAYLEGSGYMRLNASDSENEGKAIRSSYTVLIDLQPTICELKSQQFLFTRASIGFAGELGGELQRSYGRGGIRWRESNSSLSLDVDTPPSGGWRFERDRSKASLIFAPDAANRIEFSTETFFGNWPEAISSRYELEDGSRLLPILDVLSPLDER